MKKLTLLLFLFSVMIGVLHGQTQKTYYTPSVNGKILTSTEFENIVQHAKKKFKSVILDVVIKDSIVRHDSVIKVFSFHISPANSKMGVKKEGVYTFLNKKLPSLTLHTINGKEINLSNLNGKPTLINFWFTACAPCIDEMPVLNKLREKYKNKMNFIAVTFNNKESVEKFLKKHKYEFIQVVDASELTRKLGIRNYPKNIFLDSKGQVRVIEGGIPYGKNVNGKLIMGDGKDFEAILNKLLQ